MSSVDVTDVRVERALLPRLRIMTEISGEANREVLLFGLGGQFYVHDNRDGQDVIIGGITCSRPIVSLRGTNAQVPFYVDLDQSRIEAIDQARDSKDARFKMLVTGVRTYVGSTQANHVIRSDFQEWEVLARMKAHGEAILVAKSDWVEKILPELGAAKSILVELPSIEPIHPTLSEAFKLSAEAWKHYRSGDYDEALTNCRKALDSIEKSLVESDYVKETESKPDWVKLLQSSLGEELEKIEKGLRGFLQPGPHIGRPVSRP